jgi:hypothetical protein
MHRQAIQLNPHHAYAHTLSAHEHAASDDYDKATIAYRHALRIDDRHYNAWCVTDWSDGMDCIHTLLPGCFCFCCVFVQCMLHAADSAFVPSVGVRLLRAGMVWVMSFFGKKNIRWQFCTSIVP